MTRELIFLHLGERGIRLGVQLWELCAAEHGLGLAGEPTSSSDAALAKIGAAFEHVEVSPEPQGVPVERTGRYVPRALFIDLDPTALEHVRASALAKVVAPANLIAGEAGTERSFAKGHAAEALLARVSAALDAKVRATPELDGFVLIHGLGGGTGAGFGARLLEHLRARYPDAVIATFSVLPTFTAEEARVAELMSAIRSLPALEDYADVTFLLAADALQRAASRASPREELGPEHADHVAASAIAGVSALWRWDRGMSLRAMATTLTPHAKAKLQLVAHEPQVPRGRAVVRELAAAELAEGVQDANSGLSAADPRHGRTIVSLFGVRGDVPPSEVFAALDRTGERLARRDHWIPENVGVRLLPAPHGGGARTATWIANHTAVREPLALLSSTHRLLARRDDAAVRGLLGEGDDREAFDEAAARLEDAIAWYLEAEEGPALGALATGDDAAVEE